MASEKQQLVIKSPGIRNVLTYRLTPLAARLTQVVVRLLARTSITPGAITWLGFLIAVGAMVLIITEHLFAAGFVVLVAGFFDMLDGALARHTNQTTRFGAVLDSVLDRFSESALLIGILVFFVREMSFTGILLVGVALIGSFSVSYVRARAEALGMECGVGFFTRPERIVVLALGLILSQIAYALVIALAIVVVLSFVSVVQRLVHVWQQTKVK